LFKLKKTVDNYLQQATDFYYNEDYDKSLKVVDDGLQKYPQNSQLLFLRGNIFYCWQQYDSALKAYLQANEIKSDNNLLINIVDTYIRLQKYPEAQYYVSKIEGYNKYFLSGKIAYNQFDYSDAEKYFAQALEFEKNDCWLWNMFSQTLQQNKKYSQSLDACLQAIKVSNGADSQHLNLAYALYEISLEVGIKTVLPYLQKWHDLYPDNHIVQHSWNSFYPNKKFDRSLSQYIEDVFDNFADSFEEVLSELSYQAPLLITQKIKQIFAKDLLSEKRILDLGCGTGLCAENIKKNMPESHFYGVDLSSKMLEIASRKKIYKKLIKSDIETYLLRINKKYDIIVASDVFTYFGNLENILSLCAKNIYKNGAIFFTISTDKTDNDFMWKQHLSGRFLHSQKYVRECIKKSGFCNADFADSILRSEGGKNVEGYIVFATKK